MKFVKNTEGSAAVEFAIIFPILAMMLMGILEFGLIFFTYSTSQQVTWDVSRQIATNRLPATQARQALLDRMPAWVRARQDVVVAVSSTNGQSTLTIDIPAAAATPTNFLTRYYGSATIHTSVTMQQEPNS